MCKTCDTFNFDVNVIAGRYCVDGKSVMGVMEMAGRTVVLAPVTQSKSEYNEFFNKVEKIGAYKTDALYG